MTNSELHIAIDINRRALLRIVTCWLIAAKVLRFGSNRVLPHRISLWVSTFIWKVESAIFYLHAASKREAPNDAAKPIFIDEPWTILSITKRLKQIKKLLVELRLVLHICRANPRATAFCILENTNFSFGLNTHVVSTEAALSCRAPPVSHYQ